MLSIEEGSLGVKLARGCIESELTGSSFSEDEFDLPGSFDEKRGAFITLKLDGDLRGCIGRPYPEQKLKEAIKNSSLGAAFGDPRFPELSNREFKEVIVELTVLTNPEGIDNEGRGILDEIVVGRDGLIVSKGIHRGLLLPQVAVDQSWDKAEFLSETCMKAGLLPDAWLDPETEIQRFQGQIFVEENPGGEVVELDINESC
ncbi:TIGR00296 family protein [Methanonatronarchaeum sp. AMET6-2]|uniref:TIGR00296 family protein n=1 Tax=Methanonatronarchaeum sp. AMET6-2 TaxID=2933293 RepID=UPI00120CB544|nr:TIGR00296 family protein [Methanonatronarchaeum sp. AMET6-2]RZN60984.1 MAG: TIGR00296 family protein [Methanonatronarchaeia archaeon]UOY10678.1 TIGR00296 family protein [Methanonatronarchaeum sp. AMET6-2]